ncbi:hypothetical protein QPM17_03715 [Marinobacter sp. TBZ242]|uniref:Uncharacterized protein n=1 Tax=Marinobacter azerbaijanicus TaxID=3050455 RepID=A0ABT7I7U1_9GAMM|nr:hypothetical protein [Marinobacter sp. TBZ242]MDL0430216.1 hypothetical protein [Marinobacter sp. TBZ242]
MNDVMTRSEYWRLSYRRDRYLEFLSQDELEKRACDIMGNMTFLSGKGQIGLRAFSEGGAYWMPLWAHVLEEFALRYGPYPNGFTNGFVKGTALVKPSHPDEPLAKKAIDSIGGIRPGRLYKFGKKEHLEPMLKRGRIRIAPASYYSDPSLNPAIKDEELSFSIKIRPRDVKAEDMNGEEIPTFGNVEVSFESKTNYYVSCFAANYTYREFDDFEADSCIVINEPREFTKRLLSRVRRIKPDFRGFASHVDYIDPLNHFSGEINVFLAKHFRYAYQNEYRFLWVPDKPLMELDPFFVEIGDMSQYAEILSI